MQQIGVRASRATTHPASQLVQLGEPEAVRAVDDERVGVRNIEARLDDRGAHQHVEVAFGKTQHGLLELVFGHLAVSYRDARFRNQPPQPIGDRFDA